MLAPAGGESAGESFNTDWSAMNAVETEPAHAEAARPTASCGRNREVRICAR